MTSGNSLAKNAPFSGTLLTTNDAANFAGALPIVIFALLVQRHLVRGLTLGAVK